jgi:hypothetical protein
MHLMHARAGTRRTDRLLQALDVKRSRVAASIKNRKAFKKTFRRPNGYRATVVFFCLE